jgi:hypothetical protein
MTIAHGVGIAIFAVAAIAWVTAAAAALGALRHRLPDRSRFWYATHGHAFFNAGYFKPEAAPYVRLLRLAALIFFAAILLGAVGVFVLASP